MEKLDSSDPVVGPTEGKMPTTMCIKHADLPGLEDAALGARVKFTVIGKVTSNRASDKYSDGDATIEVSSIEEGETEKKKNASTMHISELKDKITKKEPEAKDSKDSEDKE